MADRDQHFLSDREPSEPPPGPRASILRSLQDARNAGEIDDAINVLDDDALEASLDLGSSGQEMDAGNVPPPAIPGYTFAAEIGHGGQGVVYRAIQESTNRAVAIKVLPGGYYAGSRQRERFEREIANLASIQHPHICGIIDRGRTPDGTFFFVMPFIAGLALDVYLTQKRETDNLDRTAVLQLFLKISHAIAEAHRLGIVHRDLKPSNILVAPNGEPYVMDFGLARVQADGTEEKWRSATITSSGQIVGSLPWASPEQAAGSRTDFRTDIYSLGLMLYKAVTDVAPYHANGPARDVLENIATAQPKRPSAHPGSLADKTLDAVILKCLQKSAADRYKDGSELSADLARALEGSRPRAHTDAAKRSRRKWLTKLAGATLIAAAVAVVCIPIWLHLTRPPQLEIIQLPAITNSVGMRLVRIPPGGFLMGSGRNEEGREASERQQHVTLSKPYYISTTEVTRGQFKAVMGRYPTGPTPTGPETESDLLPAAPVSWPEANEFCERLTRRENAGTYRLPTEGEWEYACRAGTTSSWAGTGRLKDMGWYAQNSGSQLQKVATKCPNHWGLFDMHGGVDEWCSSQFSADPTVPAATHPATQPAPATFVAVRGGNITSSETDCRSASHKPIASADPRPFTGFRPVRTDEP